MNAHTTPNLTANALGAFTNAPPVLRVPQWAIGTVHRRSITFFNAVEDTQTFVAWVQSHGMTGDIRIHPARPSIPPHTTLSDLDHATLILLASVEGGVATTSWDESQSLMSWSNWVGLQTYDKYPEPGIMRRIGDCMIEFAPSGAYVEDWRFQTSDSGPVIGLKLVSETAKDGATFARNGGCVIAGDHAMISIDRRLPLPDAVKAQDVVRASADPVAALNAVFDCTVDYAVKRPDGYRIHASTDPRREKLSWDFMSRLHAGPAGQVIERGGATDAFAARTWSVDSFEKSVAFDLMTSVGADSQAWLDREADTLLAPIGKA